MTKSSYTLPPPPVHTRERAAHFLKLLPIAALLAAGASQAWADGCSGSEPEPGVCIGLDGGSYNTNVVVTGNFDLAAGGLAMTGNAEYNTLTIESGGVVNELAVGGYAVDKTGANAERNTLIVKGTCGSAVGGLTNGGGPATGNHVFIEAGATVMDGVAGGIGYGGDATGNFVILAGGTVMGPAEGGECAPPDGESTCDFVTDNTLIVTDTDSLIKGDVMFFDTLKFTLPATIADGQTMLTLDGTVDFSTIKSASLTVDGSPTLNGGDTITLIKFNGTPVLPDPLPLPPTVDAGGYTFALNYDATTKVLTATVKADPDPAPTPYYGGGDSSSPTMGELGLLLSGIALAGAAAPALRRREKQGKKADTRQ